LSIASLTRRLSRRSSVIAVVLGGALLLAGTAVGAERASTAPSTIKIGVVLPYTGNFGSYGNQMEAVLKARFARVGNKVAGHPIQLLFEDEATDPKTAVLKVTKLLTEDRVNAVVCCVNGSSTLAVAPVLQARKILQLGPIPNPSGLESYSNAAVAAPTAAHDAELLGRYAARKLKYKTAAVLASDFSYGHEVADAFKKGFTAYGGKIASEVYPPFPTQDFGSYLSQVGNPDVVFGGFAGGDAVAFVKQYRKFGVKPPLIGHGPLVTELALKAETPEAAGVGAAFFYSSQLKTPDNAVFLSAMKAFSGQYVPSHVTAGAWTTGSVLIDTIKRLKGNIPNGVAFATAVRKTRIQAQWGLLTFDRKTGYARAATYYYKVVDNGEGLQHQIVAKLAGIG
jgi:branched-chain amino acid transport system substrate-binding protein